MGYVHARVQLANPARPDGWEELEFLVDTGAMLSVIPRTLLEKMGIAPMASRRFRAFGGTIQREVGVALMRYHEDVAGVTVVFGEEGDTAVLGVTALEALGYQVDPVTGELKPTEMLLL